MTELTRDDLVTLKRLVGVLHAGRQGTWLHRRRVALLLRVLVATVYKLDRAGTWTPGDVRSTIAGC